MPAVFDSGSTLLRLFSEFATPEPILFVPCVGGDATKIQVDEDGCLASLACCQCPLWALADIARPIQDVCFTLKSGHTHQRHRCPLSANSGHLPYRCSRLTRSYRADDCGR